MYSSLCGLSLIVLAITSLSTSAKRKAAILQVTLSRFFPPLHTLIPNTVLFLAARSLFVFHQASWRSQNVS